MRFLQNKISLWSANRLVYWIAFLFVTVLTVTGIALYRVDLGLTGVLRSHDMMRLFHGLIIQWLIFLRATQSPLAELVKARNFTLRHR